MTSTVVVCGGDRRAIDVAAATAAVDRPNAVPWSASGVVRDHDGGRRGSLPGAPERRSASSRRSPAEVAAKHDGVRLWVAHRTGQLAVGDAARWPPWPRRAAAHAFDACSGAGGRREIRLPVWKEQFSEGGSEWVGIAE